MLLALSLIPILIQYATIEIMIGVGAVFILLCGLAVWRHYRLKHRSTWGSRVSSLKTCLVLGSGGHTTELLRIASFLGPQYTPRIYIIADTDAMSERRLMESEEKRGGVEGEDFHIHRIPRSREVRQSYFSSVFSTLRSIFFSVPLMLKIRPDLVICNGPGTCIPVAALGCLMDFFRVQDCAIVFIESIARVKALSLSGEILHRLRIADKILVQWAEQKAKYPSVELIGRL